jgi:glucose-6-phosphate isomerase
VTDWSTSAADGFELFFGYADTDAFSSTVEKLVSDGVASGIAGRDATLWGPEAEDEAGKRLAWVGLAQESRALVDEIIGLRDVLADRGAFHVVLCGMGGSSLAPEVICATHGVELTVVDSSDPDYVRRAVSDRLESSVVVISSKSGGTVETYLEADLEPSAHIIVVTDPGSPLDEASTEAGYRVFHANPDVGGRYSALTAFGLVPSGLAGADIGRLLDEAEAIQPHLERDDVDNPALRLGGLLGVANTRGVDKLVLADKDSGIPGFGDWAEQLVAESTGKNDQGILPVVVPSLDAPNFDPSTKDEVLVTIGSGVHMDALPASGWGVAVDAPLGAQMLLWEYATVVAGRIIGINPFDQPDVESAKQAAREMLDGGGDTPEPAFTDGPVAVYATEGLLTDEATVADAVQTLLGQIDDERGYLAVMAYLDREGDRDLAGVRESLARRTGRPTTFGWGPRFLHSTGQYHKGGPPIGVYLQVTTEPLEDLEIAGRPFTFGTFIAAQAIGDATVLAGHDRPVLRLHLTDHDAGLAAVREVLG